MQWIPHSFYREVDLRRHSWADHGSGTSELESRAAAFDFLERAWNGTWQLTDEDKSGLRGPQTLEVTGIGLCDDFQMRDVGGDFEQILAFFEADGLPRLAFSGNDETADRRM